MTEEQEATLTGAGLQCDLISVELRTLGFRFADLATLKTGE